MDLLEAKIRQAQQLVSQGRAHEAAKLYQSLLKRHPENLPLHVEHSEALLHAGFIARCRAYPSDWRGRFPSP